MLNSELNLNTFCVRDEAGNCDVAQTAEKFATFLQEYAASVKADNETISAFIDSVYDMAGNKGKKTLPKPYVVNQVVGMLGADSPEAFSLATERVSAYIKESGRFVSTKGPNGGFARKDASEPPQTETVAA